MEWCEVRSARKNFLSYFHAEQQTILLPSSLLYFFVVMKFSFLLHIYNVGRLRKVGGSVRCLRYVLSKNYVFNACVCF